jgi:hypothetical protein
MTEIEKSLGTLADRINVKHRACETAANAALEHAMSAGDLLSEAKTKLPHGEFGAWIEENFAGSARTARAYMRVASHRDELEAKRQSSATLSLDGALKALSAPKSPPTLAELEARAESTLQEAQEAEENLEALLEKLRAEASPEEYHYLAGYYRGRMQAARERGLSIAFGD